MPDSFSITIITVVIFTVITAFIKGRIKDRCIKDFENEYVTLEEKNGKTVWGKLSVENTGFELIYKEKKRDIDGHFEASYILYKTEFSNIQALIRYYDELNEYEKKWRAKELNRIYHPNFIRKLKRKTLNAFKTVRDSLTDMINMLMGQARRSPLLRMSAQQDKYLSKLKDEYITAIENTYEPLLERHIGKIVVLEMAKADKIVEYAGVLKDYTSEFIEIMDVSYNPAENNKVRRKADIIVPRSICFIRHLGE